MTNPQYPYQGDQQYPAGPAGVSDKSKIVAGLLGILLGGLGAGRFYTGHTKIAVLQLVASLCTGIGVIWPIVDGILILINGGTDSEGRPLRDS
jgi:TM2 domain-containing membrane protein YozV